MIAYWARIAAAFVLLKCASLLVKDAESLLTRSFKPEAPE